MPKKVKQPKQNSRKIRGKYKEVTTIRMEVQEGTVIVLQCYAIHAYKFKKDIETGRDILELQYHEMGKGQKRRENERKYVVEKNAQGVLDLRKVKEGEEVQ